ncbi:SusC/RagA family TonB-linked outer membrane protein [Butyricimonas paravirosa]|uniref:SusC/RagA family TonB-linked outer membrane protein n=1 Tax=Butyricimonas paravirosa TaxID=1472417 RepID=UPI0021095B7E|nr:SusC/RagA family TonB-linked outer membrane protein [Butyricimonas paravirosa]MCQ4872275.1 SusC/RagA family TonB-linked outer membrane protein [Butyricimonas paravirosa]
MKKKRIGVWTECYVLSRKMLIFMKFLTIIMVLACMSVHARGLSQAMKVTLEVKRVSLNNFFLELRKQTNCDFLYNYNLIKDKQVSVKVEEKELSKVLDEILPGLGLEYYYDNNVVVIREKPQTQQQRKELRISGIVKDKKGTLLPGVTILIKGTTVGTSTGQNGQFVFTIPQRDSVVLCFSFIGMISREVEYKGEKELVVVLEEEKKVIEEVIVTGYQKIRKSEMVGSTNTISREDLFYDGTNSIEQMLQGKLPGTVVMNTSGYVGVRQKVRVRGTSTLLSNPEPVWVVDGIIQEDPVPFNVQEFGNMADNFDMIKDFVGNGISWLNPNDIENITVLKDASATVLYGVKAANGVIVITTKRGKSSDGEMSVNYSGGFAITEKLNYDKMNLMNSKQRIDVSREIYERRILGNKVSDLVGYEHLLRLYLNKEISYYDFDSGVKKLETMNTDWMDILYRVPFSHNHSLSISGGNSKANYYASVNYRKTFGIAKGNENDSYGGSVNLDARITDKLNISVRLSGSVASTKAFYQVDPYTYAIQTSRAISPYDDNGKLFFYPMNGALSFNVLNELDETGNSNETRSLNVNVNLNWALAPGIRIESLFGLNTSNMTGESYASENTYYIASIRGYDKGGAEFGSDSYKQSPLPHGGELNTTETHNTSVTWRNSLTYNQVFGLHRVGASIGQELRTSVNKGSQATTYGYFPERGKGITLPDRTIMQRQWLGTGWGDVAIPNPIYDKMVSKITDTKSNVISFYATATYSFAERYVLTGSVRTDASNRFGQDKRNRFLPVWSTGIRWNVHNEPWLEGQSILSELNIRLSYGWQGNVAENFGPDLIASIPENVVHPITKEYQLVIKTLPYADLRWEKTKSINLGVDLGLLSNRFTGTVEYYEKRTEDMIIMKEVPCEFGTASMPINGGKMMNRGLELSLNGTLIRSKNVTWSLGLNTSKNFNKLESSVISNNNWETAVSGNFHKGGYAVSSFWVFDYAGLDSEYGYPLFNIPTREENPDIVNDPTTYMKYAGKLEPDFTGGLNTVFRYKTFSLSASFNLSLGNKRFLNKLFAGEGNTKMAMLHLPSPYYNLSKEYVNRWRKPGDEAFTDIPAIPSLDAAQIPDPSTIDLDWSQQRLLYAYELYDNSNVRVVNASFLRCNNLSLSYSLPDRVLRYLGVKSLSVNGSVSNPFMIVSKGYKGVDPEVATGKQPITKTYSLGINVTF